MTRTALLLGALAAWGAAAAQDVTPTAAELVARNLAARGGAAKWSQIRTLELRGTFDAWSDPVAMTIERARPAQYRFDHAVFGAPAVLACDAKTPWLAAAAMGATEAQPIADPWGRNVIEDSGFISRLQQLAEDGAPLEVLGRGDVDGVAAWKLRASPTGVPTEVWYLDAKTGLELKRESTTFDVFSGAIEMPMETYYMDFREVEGVQIPFREERHFGTRYQVFLIDAARINPTIDPARFTAPKKKEAPAPEGPAPG